MTTSTTVRVSPPVPGMRPLNGGSRMVPGRSQYNGEPIGGMNRRLSGPNPHPSPSTSKSIVQSANLKKTSGARHQVPGSNQPSIPGVVMTNAQPIATNTIILTRYISTTTSGEPKPCSAKCRAIGRMRSWRLWWSHSS